MSEISFVKLTSSQPHENAPKSKELTTKPLTPTKQKERALAWRKMRRYDKKHGHMTFHRPEYNAAFTDAESWYYYLTSVVVIATKQPINDYPVLTATETAEADPQTHRIIDIVTKQMLTVNKPQPTPYSYGAENLQRLETAYKQGRKYIKIGNHVYTPAYLYETLRIIDPQKHGVTFGTSTALNDYIKGPHGYALLATVYLDADAYACYLKDNNLTD